VVASDFISHKTWYFHRANVKRGEADIFVWMSLAVWCIKVTAVTKPYGGVPTIKLIKLYYFNIHCYCMKTFINPKHRSRKFAYSPSFIFKN